MTRVVIIEDELPARERLVAGLRQLEPHIESCDAVLAAFTQPDEGTAMEAWYAHRLGKPVIAYTGGTPAHPWTVYVATRVCRELEEAVAALDVL